MRGTVRRTRNGIATTMSHHHAHQRTRGWYAWRNLMLIWTVVVALLVHRATHLGIIAATIIGFAVAAGTLRMAFIAIERRKPPN